MFNFDIMQCTHYLHPAPVDGPVSGGHDEHAGAEAEQRGRVEGVGEREEPLRAAGLPRHVETVRVEVELVVAASAA